MPSRLLSLIIPVLFVVLSYQMVKNQEAVERRIHYFQWDQAGYYSYLPALFLYEQDWTFSFFDENGMQSAQFLKKVDGVDFNKYPVGVSILQMPFFAAGHIVAGLHGDAQNGFTKPYRYAVFGSILFYVCLGLLLLRSVLHRYFTSWTVFFSLGIMALGTHLIYYTCQEPLMSHAYSFFIFSAIVFISDRFYREEKGTDILWMGLLAGFVFLTRVPNAIVFIVPVLWGVRSWEQLRERINSLWEKKIYILGAIVLIVLTFFPQLLYYKTVLGTFFVDSYGSERFFFADPLLGKIFFSFRKGLFIYTPLTIFAFLGFLFLHKYLKFSFWAVTIYTLLQLYVVSSWSSWWYGGGFSMRPLVESMALLIFPLACFIEETGKRPWTKWSFPILLIPFFWLHELHLHQYYKSIIHNDSMTKDAYKVIFGKRHPVGQEVRDQWQELLVRPDPGRANKDAEYRKNIK